MTTIKFTLDECVSPMLFFADEISVTANIILSNDVNHWCGKGTLKANNKTLNCFVKQLDPSIHTTEHSKDLIQKLKEHCYFPHPNIVHIYGFAKVHPYEYIVMECAKHSDLEEYLNNISPLSPDLIIALCCHVAAAVKVLHDNNMCHRDIKPKNMLIDLNENGHVSRIMLCDFDTLKIDGKKSHTPLGTYGYWAPEVVKKIHTDNPSTFLPPICYEAADIYSVGRVLQCIAQATNFVPNVISVHAAEVELQKLIEECTTEDPNERPSIDAVHLSLLQIKAAIRGTSPIASEPSCLHQ